MEPARGPLSAGFGSKIAAGLTIGFACAFPAWTQPKTASLHPAFEVASIKLNRNPPIGARALSLSASLSHGRVTFEAVTLKDLLQQAYDLQREQVSGCPAWCDSDRFDLIAKAEDPNITKDQVMPMLQALLADRFQITSHRETKDRPGYALIPGKGGPRLKVASENEALGFASSGYVRTFQKMPIAGLVSFLSPPDSPSQTGRVCRAPTTSRSI